MGSVHIIKMAIVNKWRFQYVLECSCKITYWGFTSQSNWACERRPEDIKGKKPHKAHTFYFTLCKPKGKLNDIEAVVFSFVWGSRSIMQFSITPELCTNRVRIRYQCIAEHNICWNNHFKWYIDFFLSSERLTFEKNTKTLNSVRAVSFEQTD